MSGKYFTGDQKLSKKLIGRTKEALRQRDVYKRQEEVIGIALCWDTAYYPYRTDKYEGWTNFPGWGVINCETWYNLHPIG